MKLLVHICLYHRFILFLNHFKTFTVETPDKYKEVKHYQDIFFFFTLSLNAKAVHV